MKKEYYVGMDVHKDTVQIAVFAHTGEKPVYERRLHLGGTGLNSSVRND